jgi:hypothetical protein
MTRLVCWLFGHRPYADPSRPFSTRLGVCSRCQGLPSQSKSRSNSSSRGRP